MGLQNKIETELERLGVTVSEFESDNAFTTFMINTADTSQVADAAGLLDEVLCGQRVIIERFDGTDVTSFQIENQTITVSEVTGLATNPFDQKFLDGENVFIEINIHELNLGTPTLNTWRSFIGFEEHGIVYDG